MKKGYHLKSLILVLIYFFVAGFLVMLLWNWLLPSIVGVRVINIWEACGLILLTNFLFSKTFFRRLIFRKKYEGDKWALLCDDNKEKLSELWEKRCKELEQAKNK
jgi:hypothetical protein